MQTLVTIVLAAIGGLVLLWLVLLAVLAIARPDGTTVRESARIVPDAIRLATRLSRDRSLGRAVRIRIALLLAYLALPIDLVPDFIPVLGYADDAVVIGVVLRSVIRRVGPEVVRRHWPGTPTGLATLGRLCRVPELAVPPDRLPRDDSPT